MSHSRHGSFPSRVYYTVQFGLMMEQLRPCRCVLSQESSGQGSLCFHRGGGHEGKGTQVGADGGRRRPSVRSGATNCPLSSNHRPEGGFTVTSPLTPGVDYRGRHGRGRPGKRPRRLGGRHRGVSGNGKDATLPNLVISDPTAPVWPRWLLQFHDVPRVAKNLTSLGCQELPRTGERLTSPVVQPGDGSHHRRARLGSDDLKLGTIRGIVRQARSVSGRLQAA